MSAATVEFTLFTKPWPDHSIPDLAAHVAQLGFHGVELPVRPGFQVAPERVERDLPEAARVFAGHGLRIASIAGPADEPTIAACAAAGVPLIRIMAAIPPGVDYLTAVAERQREWDRLVPVLARYEVGLGVQNHSGRWIANAMQLRHAIKRYDPARIGAVWDAAHNALQGENQDLALDTIWSHLRLVNLKNAFMRRTNGPEAAVAEWASYWTTGRCGLADWRLTAAELNRRGYTGDVCLTAEYTEQQNLEHWIVEDLAYARSLFAGAAAPVSTLVCSEPRQGRGNCSA